VPPTSEILYCLILFVVIATECLIAVWAATSPRPRLLRAIVVWLAIVPLIPIGANWPALFFTVNAVATVLVIALIRAAQRRGLPPDAARPRGKLTISHLLIATLAIATALAVCVRLRLTNWQSVLLIVIMSLPLAPLCACAHFAAVGPQRRTAVIASLACALVSASLLLSMEVGQNLDLVWLTGPRPDPRNLHWHLLTLGCLTASIVLLIWASIQIRRRPPQPWKRVLYLLAAGVCGLFGILLACRYSDDLWYNGLPLFRRYGPDWLMILATLIVLALVVAGASRAQITLRNHPPQFWTRGDQCAGLIAVLMIALPAGWVYWHMLWPLRFPPPPAGGANHCERIVEIGREFAGQRQMLSRHGEPIAASPLLDEAVTLLLSGSNSIPPWMLEAELAGESQRTIRHQHLWALDWQLTALRDQGARVDRGVDYALALVRLETMLHRGGLTAHANMERHRFTRNEEWLARNMERISIDNARRVVHILERSLDDREDPAILRERDRVYSSRLGGWSKRLRGILRNRPIVVLPTAKFNEIHAANLSLRGLAVLYAVRLFQHEHGRVPHNLAELTPQYLESVPMDPYSGQPLVYQAHSDWHSLYSVGPDGQDDGGRFSSQPAAGETGYDLDLSWRNRKPAGQ